MTDYEENGQESPHPEWLSDDFIAGMDEEISQVDDTYDRVSPGNLDGRIPEEERDEYKREVQGNEVNG